ncbi:FAD/NAD(P)-binding protein [Gelidibacter sp.]|uniref:FAD/NAD(P)-binding protein n=1 Tax=Gelidibacter sp. TaxID=2018083 RepID=UPI003265C6B8
MKIDTKVGIENFEFEFAFIGSGISSTFTLLHFLEQIKDKPFNVPLRIGIFDKEKDFFTGIPYGKRSGTSSLLITSLKNFLPQPELGKFIIWLTENKISLLKEFKEEGGELIREWFSDNRQAIAENAWEDLFIPRYFFGRYLTQVITQSINEYEERKIVKVDLIQLTVENIIPLAQGYEILGASKSYLANNVIFCIGSPPPKKVWNKNLNGENHLNLFADPYNKGMNTTISEIKKFLETNNNSNFNALIIGSNASALEVLFMMNDNTYISNRIQKFTFISTHGLLPDSINSKEHNKVFMARNLLELENKVDLTAKDIADAAFADLDLAEKMGIGAATSVVPISKAFGVLLNKLDKSELEIFACHFGNEIGRRQRCAGVFYLQTINRLQTLNKFEHIAGRFLSIVPINSFTYSFKYLDTRSKTEVLYKDPINIIINCIGSETLNEPISNLYTNLINSGLCVPNPSYKGFKVNSNFEASNNFYIIGPLLSGNVINNKAVWHVEHCGRIIAFSKILGVNLSKSVLYSMEA